MDASAGTGATMIDRTRIGALVVALAACGGGGAKPPSSDDALIATWRSAKLEVSALTAIDGKPYAAKDCRGGTVSGVDVVVCSYGSGEDAQAAQELGLATIGDATGAAAGHDRLPQGRAGRARRAGGVLPRGSARAALAATCGSRG